MTRLLSMAALVAAVFTAISSAQGLGNSNWPTIGADAQRTSWMRNEVKLSAAAPAFQFLWKTRLDSQPSHAVAQPLLLQNIISHKGFKALAFVGAGPDVYAIDYDLNRVYWKQRLSTAARVSNATAACPGGVTAITRATPGLPGARGGPPPSRGPINTANLPINSAVYALSSGGMLHFLNPHIGADLQPAVKFLPPNAKVAGLIAIDNVLYASTADGCGGAANGVWALDLGSEAKAVTRWESNGGSVVGASGPAFGFDGAVYAAIGAGGSSAGGYSNAVVALESRSLKLRDHFTAPTPFTSSPTVFRFRDRELVAAANSDGRMYLLDARALGGTTHTAPLARSMEYGPVSQTPNQALATWEEPAGTRWLLAPSRTAVAAFKVVEAGGTLSLEKGWTSREIAPQAPPAILNDIVLVVGGARTAVLYALDARTGKELWNSGSSLTASSAVAPSAGDSQVYVVTSDGTLYAFGLPQER